MTDYLKTLMKTLEQRRMRTALESVPATEEDPGYENRPVLIRVVIAGKHQLIHPSNFVDLLSAEMGQVLDPVTLEFIDVDDLPTTDDLKRWGMSEEKIAELGGPKPPTLSPGDDQSPAEAPPAEGTTPPADEQPPTETPPDAVVPTKPVWSESELEALGKEKGGYNKLRSISKLYDDVPGNASKAELIKAISGKPKP